ncbi:MAG: AI-2E family transporter [Oscillospiraceae bacterium]|nr:AI-2E family transporter [Oscillospiraceae bacterium]
MDKSKMKKTAALIAFGILLFWGLENRATVLDFLLTTLGMLTPFLLGLCLAFVINVPMRSIEKHLFTRRKWGQKQIAQKLKRPASIVITLLLFCLGLGIILFQIIPQVDETVRALSQKLPGFVKWLQECTQQLSVWIPEIKEYIGGINFNWQTVIDAAMNFLQTGATSIVNSTLGIATGVFSGVMNILLALVFAIYFLAQKEKFSAQFHHLTKAYLKDRPYEKLNRVASIANITFTKFITGQCTEAVIVGFMFFIVMSLLGFPYALLIAIVVGVTALIPMLGAYIGYVFALCLILVAVPERAIWFTVVFVLLQQLDGNIVYPRVVGNSVGLPSIWVLVAVTLGGSLMGILGMLISVPLCSIIYALTQESVRVRLEKKQSAAQAPADAPKTAGPKTP